MRTVYFQRTIRPKFKLEITQILNTANTHSQLQSMRTNQSDIQAYIDAYIQVSDNLYMISI